ALRVQSREREVPKIQRRLRRGGRIRFGEHRGRESERCLGSFPQDGEGRGELGLSGGRGHMRSALRHGSTLGGVPAISPDTTAPQMVKCYWRRSRKSSMKEKLMKALVF